MVHNRCTYLSHFWIETTFHSQSCISFIQISWFSSMFKRQGNIHLVFILNLLFLNFAFGKIMLVKNHWAGIVPRLKLKTLVHLTLTLHHCWEVNNVLNPKVTPKGLLSSKLIIEYSSRLLQMQFVVDPYEFFTKGVEMY